MSKVTPTALTLGLGLTPGLGRHPRSSAVAGAPDSASNHRQNNKFPFCKPGNGIKGGSAASMPKALRYNIHTHEHTHAVLGARKVIARTPPKAGRTNGHGQKPLC